MRTRAFGSRATTAGRTMAARYDGEAIVSSSAGGRPWLEMVAAAVSASIALATLRRTFCPAAVDSQPEGWKIDRAQ